MESENKIMMFFKKYDTYLVVFFVLAFILYNYIKVSNKQINEGLKNEIISECLREICIGDNNYTECFSFDDHYVTKITKVQLINNPNAYRFIFSKTNTRCEE